jgi:hypothetical protein
VYTSKPASGTIFRITGGFLFAISGFPPHDPVTPLEELLSRSNTFLAV